MLGNQMRKFLKLCRLRNSNEKPDVLVEILVLNVMVPRRLTRKDVLQVSIGSLLLIVTAFIITYGVILHQVDRKLYLAKHQLDMSSSLSLKDAQNRQTKKVKFKFIPKYNVGQMKQDRPIMWKPGEFIGKTSEQPQCVHNSKFIVLITSAPQHSERRSAIRKTWCNPYASEQSPNSWQCIFVIGSVQDSILAESINSERKIYNDILLGNYIDSYRNLTYKVVSSFVWSKNYCPCPYVVKTDDDCFVNTKLLYHFLTEINTKTSDLYAGKIFLEDVNLEVIRDKENKWHVSQEDYESNRYPPYASGTGYIMSQDVVSRIADESVYHSPIPIEDAYTGILAHKLNIEPVYSARFMVTSAGLSICNYLYMFVIHHVEPKQQYMMHSNMIRARTECKDEDVLTWF